MPLIIAAPGDARKSAAPMISSASPIRPIGIPLITWAMAARPAGSDWACGQPRVRKWHGAIELTRMP